MPDLSFLFVPQAPDPIRQALAETTVVLGTDQLLLRSACAAGLGAVLAVVYRATHRGLSYSQSFMQTIVFVAAIVALVMMTVRNSLATAFTLVGALSIIRFRTVVKDTRDTAFVFASLAVGMAVGLGYWELAGIGTVVIGALAGLMHATNFGALYKSDFVLRFTFDQQRDSSAYLGPLQQAARRANMLHIEPSGDGRSLRLTYDVALRREQTAEQLTSALSRVPGVSDVALIVARNDVEY